MRQVIQFPENRLIQDQHTGGWIDFECRFVPANEVNRFANWYYYPDPSEKLGDFIRVLRKRPTRPGTTPELEYIPNDLYSFQMVKSILKDYTNVKVKGSRFWDDKVARVPKGRILYTLHDYCPGMPVNLEQECKDLHLPPFLPIEIVTYKVTMPNAKDRHLPNTRATIEKMVSLNIIAVDSVATVQEFENKLKPIMEGRTQLLDRYVAVPRLFLELHWNRLETIKDVCSNYFEEVRTEILQAALANPDTPAQSGGQNGVPNGEPQEQFRQDNGQGGGAI